jgi:hypothetical protein
MFNLTLGFAIGFGCALYEPARTVVINGVKRLIAFFRDNTTEQK